MLTRTEQLKYCKICKHRSFSQKEGIICELTGTQADFILNCDNYSGDEKTITSNNQRKDFENRIAPDFTFGLDSIGVTNGAIAGLIFIGLGLTWIIIGVFFNRLFLYPLVFILAGSISIILSLINKVRRNAQTKTNVTNDDTLDL